MAFHTSHCVFFLSKLRIWSIYQRKDHHIWWVRDALKKPIFNRYQRENEHIRVEAMDWWVQFCIRHWRSFWWCLKFVRLPRVFSENFKVLWTNPQDWPWAYYKDRQDCHTFVDGYPYIHGDLIESKSHQSFWAFSSASLHTLSSLQEYSIC